MNFLLNMALTTGDKMRGMWSDGTFDVSLCCKQNSISAPRLTKIRGTARKLIIKDLTLYLNFLSLQCFQKNPNASSSAFELPNVNYVLPTRIYVLHTRILINDGGLLKNIVLQ